MSMTVKELIAELQKHPPDRTVHLYRKDGWTWPVQRVERTSLSRDYGDEYPTRTLDPDGTVMIGGGYDKTKEELADEARQEKEREKIYDHARGIQRLIADAFAGTSFDPKERKP